MHTYVAKGRGEEGGLGTAVDCTWLVVNNNMFVGAAACGSRCVKEGVREISPSAGDLGGLVLS